MAPALQSGATFDTAEERGACVGCAGSFWTDYTSLITLNYFSCRTFLRDEYQRTSVISFFSRSVREVFCFRQSCILPKRCSSCPSNFGVPLFQTLCFSGSNFVAYEARKGKKPSLSFDVPNYVIRCALSKPRLAKPGAKTASSLRV